MSKPNEASGAQTLRALLVSFGCKVNQYETAAMRTLLEREGYIVMRDGAAESGGGLENNSPVDGVQKNGIRENAAPDVIVVNSCTVTAEADRQVRQALRRLRREYPQAVLALTGCMPQAFPDAAYNADVVLGNAARAALPARIAEYIESGACVIDIAPHSDMLEPLIPARFAGRRCAYIKIEDGCDRHCLYCIVPTARGPVRCKPPADIRAETETLAAAGHREIALVGINLTAYTYGLAEAVAAACAVPEVQQVTLGSLEPDRMDDALLAGLAAQDKFKPDFHLSLQSGCDATLRRMGRPYTGAEVAALCEQLRVLWPSARLSADILTGFPGESDAEFEETRRFLTGIRLDACHVFAYSPRPGTPAAAMENQVPQAAKRARSRMLREIKR